MFGKLKRQLFANRGRWVALLLLPTFFLGTVPQTACVCLAAEGQTACPMLAGETRACCAVEGKKRGCCDKSAATVSQSCCQVSSVTDRQSHETRVAGKPCCQRVVMTPAPARVGFIQVQLNEPGVQYIVDELPLPTALVAGRLIALAAVDAGPPPRDLVVVLQRFTI